MSLKLRLTVVQFLEYFIWGSWLISFGGYLMKGLEQPASMEQIGAVFATAGLASLITPGILGVIADKWINSERLLGICHLVGAVVLFKVSQATTYEQIYPLMMLYSMTFMPTIALSYSVSYSLLNKAGLEPVKTFPPIRVWGTVGFIVAMWLVDYMEWTLTANQLLLAAGAALVLGIYAFTLPASPPLKLQKGAFWKSAFNWDALILFKDRKMVLFFLFSVLVGICLQITNAFGTPFLQSFAFNPEYSGSFAVEHSNIIQSIGQISEALFILAIPFFLRRYGIKTVILMSIGAWVLRFGLFGIGNPGTGVIWLLLSMIIYGMAFDFFNIAGSLFIEKEAPPHIRSASQGILMMTTNGLGSLFGNLGAGLIIGYFTHEGVTHWSGAWFIFAGYALIIGLLFAVLFKYKR